MTKHPGSKNPLKVLTTPCQGGWTWFQPRWWWLVCEDGWYYRWFVDLETFLFLSRCTPSISFERVYLGVSLNGGTPETTVVGYHHFRKPPFRYFCIPSASPIKPAITTLLGQDCSWAKFHVFVAKVTMESLGEGCVRMGVKKTYIYIYMYIYIYICGSWSCSWLVFQTAMFFFNFIVLSFYNNRRHDS